jgi:sortase A
MRAAATVLLVFGLLLLAEVVITVAWQEPFSALSARHQQKVLANQLDRAQQASLPPATLAELDRLKTDRRRIAALAQRLDRRTALGDPLGRIAIPKIGVSFVFVAGSGTKSLKKGPGHYADTALPGEKGTVGIAGHRTTYLAPFRNIDRLRKGDGIVLNMPYGRFAYTVEGSIVVSPSNVAPLRRVQHGRLVLTTCTPLFSAAKRLVVTGRLTSVAPLGAAVERPSRNASRSPYRSALLGPAARQLAR